MRESSAVRPLKRSTDKIKLKIVAYFSAAKYDHQPTIVYHAFHHKLTTKTPHSTTTILQNPPQKHYSTTPGKKMKNRLKNPRSTLLNVLIGNPNLHRSRLPIRPGVVGNQLHRSRTLRRLRSRSREVQRHIRSRLADRRRMSQHHHSIQQTSLEMRRSRTIKQHRIARKIHPNAMVRLIQMLHAEHDRPALKRNSSAILCYSRVRLQQMRRHIETQIDRVILRPTLANRQVFTRLCACDLLAVHLDTVL